MDKTGDIVPGKTPHDKQASEETPESLEDSAQKRASDLAEAKLRKKTSHE